MDVKQIEFDSKTMIEQNSIKRFIFCVNNLEERLLSIEVIHEKLFEFMSILSTTHQNIVEDLRTIKTVLNQTTIKQEDDEIIPIDETKSEWDDDDDDEIESKKLNQNVRQNDILELNSSSSNISSSTIENRQNSLTNKNSSNSKKSDQLTSRIKSPRSVSFNLDQNLPNQQQKPMIPTVQQLPKEKKNSIFNEITTPMIPFLSSDLLKQNQFEIKSKLRKTLTNIRIHEIESKHGDYLRLLNLSNSDDYDLSEHFLQQTIHSKPLCRFQFPFNTIIRHGQTITVWCGRMKDIIPQPPYVFLWKEQANWETNPECLTVLAKPNGQPIAWFQNSDCVNTDQSSSDILFVHSKFNTTSSDVSSTSSSSTKNASRLLSRRQNGFSSFNLIGNNKPPFAHSPNNPIHPDHNGTNRNIPHDLRSQMHQKGHISQLLNRAKSSPFASLTGCKQDLISRQFLQTQRQKQTTIKT